MRFNKSQLETTVILGGNKMCLPIRNSYWVIPGKFIAGEYPRSQDVRNYEEYPYSMKSMISMEKLTGLVESGVTCFMDLTDPEEHESYAESLYEFNNRELVYQRFPIVDGYIPGKAQMRNILDAIQYNLNENRKIYLHCWGGIGRTGTVVGCWLAEQSGDGFAGLLALKEMWLTCPKSVRRQSPENFVQEHYIVKWTNRLTYGLQYAL
ncbi:MAG: dual specificity protein phosphatase family protein [SAR324 cluster bacterium]|nr:dual specificity protein phosphatase family protein [SAR324 cluster bacterium]